MVLHDDDDSSYDSCYDTIHAVGDVMMLLVSLSLALKLSSNPMDQTLDLDFPCRASETYFSSNKIALEKQI
jgi:hypothetical protein